MLLSPVKPIYLLGYIGTILSGLHMRYKILQRLVPRESILRFLVRRP